MTYEQFFWFVTGFCNSQPDSEWAKTIRGVADTVKEVKEIDPALIVMPPIMPVEMQDDEISGFADLLDQLPIEDLPVFGDKPINTEKQEWEIDDGKEKEVKDSLK